MNSDTVLKDNKAESEAIAKNIKGLSDKIEENFTKASNLFLNGDSFDWAGKDADAYKEKLGVLKDKVVSSIKEIEDLSNNIQKQSNQIEEQDITNKDTAEDLFYK